MRTSLIISPSKEIVNLLSTSLSEEYRVDTIDDLNEALSIYQKKPSDIIFFDLIVLDNASNLQNYQEAFKAFRKINPLVDIVVLSSMERNREMVKAVKFGADEFLNYPIDPAEVRLIVESLHKSLSKKQELDYLRDKFWKTEWIDIIRTRTSGLQEAFQKLRAVAPTIATVLLTGETGTGKGLMARIIHQHSNRCEKAFISVHCGAIPDTLLESELFGHEKGAFTGAVRRRLGKFEIAKGGTIFLDEIGTITHRAQIKLLQILQDGTFSRVGGEEILATDARIIAATNADLAGMCDRGEFRNDLYYRLNVFPIEIPPLRERVEDIPFLCEILLNKLNQKHGKNIQTVKPQVIHAFKNYLWPGNIRELENLLERAHILETGATLAPESFPAELFESGAAVAAVLPIGAQQPLSEARRQAIDDFERQYLKELFSRNKGKVIRAAEEAGVSTRQLNKLMIKHGIRKETFKE
jgi:DNA-binding NtrC family response regulator